VFSRSAFSLELARLQLPQFYRCMYPQARALQFWMLLVGWHICLLRHSSFEYPLASECLFLLPLYILNARVSVHHTPRCRQARHETGPFCCCGAACGRTLHARAPLTYITAGWLPSVDAGRLVGMISRALLNSYSLLQLRAPWMPNHGFIKLLIKLSAANHRVTALARGVFNDSSRECRFLLQALDSGVSGHNPIIRLLARGAIAAHWPRRMGSRSLFAASQRRDYSDLHHHVITSETMWCASCFQWHWRCRPIWTDVCHRSQQRGFNMRQQCLQSPSRASANSRLANNWDILWLGVPRRVLWLFVVIWFEMHIHRVSAFHDLRSHPTILR